MRFFIISLKNVQFLFVFFKGHFAVDIICGSLINFANFYMQFVEF